jgi:DNA-binding XRE family transcriptional regulator
VFKHLLIDRINSNTATGLPQTGEEEKRMPPQPHWWREWRARAIVCKDEMLLRLPCPPRREPGRMKDHVSIRDKARKQMAEETSTIEALLRRLGQRIHELRIRQGCPLKELADASGIDADTLERIEQGEIDLTLGTIIQLTLKLGTSTCAIFDEIGL